MISFRYHLISVVAIFLALGLGVVVGTTALNGAVTGDLRRQVTDLKATNREATAQVAQLQSSAGSANTLAQTYGAKILAGRLTNTPVVLIGTPSAPSALLSAVATEVTAAGGRITGQLKLTADLIDPTHADAIRSLATSAHPISQQLPTTDDAGTLAGALLGYVLLGHGQATDLPTVLSGFSQLGLLTATGSVTAGKLVLLVAPGGAPAADLGTKTLSTMSTEMATVGGPVVVLGDGASAASGLVAIVRGDSNAKGAVSTVDDIDTPVGQLTAVLAGADALAGHKGHYGTAAGATGLLPGASS